MLPLRLAYHTTEVFLKRIHFPLSGIFLVSSEEAIFSQINLPQNNNLKTEDIAEFPRMIGTKIIKNSCNPNLGLVVILKSYPKQTTTKN